MKFFLFLSLICCSTVCYGNHPDTFSVKKVVEQLELVIGEIDAHSSLWQTECNSLKDSISSLNAVVNSLQKRLEDYETFKARSEGNDSAVWEYGSSIVGVMLGLIVLFGIIYHFAAINAARSVFEGNFGTYIQRLNDMMRETKLTKNRLQTDYKLLNDAYKDKKVFDSNLNDGYE